jgi:hypothetical protein
MVSFPDHFPADKADCRLLQIRTADRAELLVPREIEAQELDLGRSRGAFGHAVSFIGERNTPEEVEADAQTIIPGLAGYYTA